MAELAGRTLDLDTSTLLPVVRKLLCAPAATIENGWSCRPIGGGGGEGTGLYQVTGLARVDGAATPWTLILKTYPASDDVDPRAWAYPAREGLVYRSGLLESLPDSISVTRCLAVEAQPDGTDWLWLEAVTDEQPDTWSLARFALVARHLGRFNGAYLTGMPTPDHPWLSQGWLRDFVEPSGQVIADLERIPRAGDHPLVQELYPRFVVSELRRLWDERSTFFAALDALPQTLCHHDAFRRNVLIRAGPIGDDVVVIDWAYVGQGAVGQELVALVAGSAVFFETGAITPHDLDETCFAAYMEGLREAGWAGDGRLVRLGFTAAAALRYTIGTLQLMLPYIADPAEHPAMEALFRRPIAGAVDAWVELWPFQFQLAAEARTLLPLVGL